MAQRVRDGTSRILNSQACNQATEDRGVRIISGGASAVTESGGEGARWQHHPASVLIVGPGFQATGFLAPMRITGRAGRDLNDAWRNGAEAYLGISVRGFPNLFMLYGPNTNLGHNSIVYMLESQIAYVISALDTLERHGQRSLEVRERVQSDFNQRLQRRMRATVWDSGCHSWYKTENGLNTNNWPGFTFTYRRLTRRLEPADYEMSP